MGRRLGRTVSTAPGERNSIGDFAVQEACTRLTAAAQAEAALLLPRIDMDTKLINALFDPVALVKLRAAYGLVEPSSSYHTYKLEPHAPGVVKLTFTNTGTLTPESKCFLPNDAAKPFFEVARQLREIHIRWGAVKHMLRWFNRNATVSAARALWPAVMNLCPNATPLRELAGKPSERYNTPAGLREQLPLIRTTAATVAQLQLLGDRSGNANQGIILTMPQETVTLEGVPFAVDHTAYNL